MVTTTKREAVRESLGPLERAQQAKQEQLARVRAVYGKDVSHMAEAAATDVWYTALLKLKMVGPFRRIVFDALRRNDPRPTKVVVTGNFGDVVITLSDDEVRFQYYGDLEFLKLSFFQKTYLHKPGPERPLRIDFSVPVKPYLDTIHDNDFGRAMDRLNSGHCPI